MKTVIFDLDGTLLPMDEEKFIQSYFTKLCMTMARYGYDSDLLTKTFWQGTKIMGANDGHCTNEEAFWEFFEGVYGKEKLNDKDKFEYFYAEIFPEVKGDCEYTPLAKEIVDDLNQKGVTVILATNPFFPRIATEHRVRWAGLEPSDFKWITTYENSSYCKPNPKYYEEILERFNLDPKDCIMVGNDTEEDLVVKEMGMDVFLITDHLIDRNHVDISDIPHGTFHDLKEYLKGAFNEE